MRLRRLLPLLSLLLVCTATPARAQLADAKVLTAAAVKKALAAAEAEAHRNGWAVSIAVVDAAGELLARLDLTGWHITKGDPLFPRPEPPRTRA